MWLASDDDESLRSLIDRLLFTHPEEQEFLFNSRADNDGSGEEKGERGEQVVPYMCEEGTQKSRAEILESSIDQTSTTYSVVFASGLSFVRRKYGASL